MVTGDMANQMFSYSETIRKFLFIVIPLVFFSRHKSITKLDFLLDLKVILVTQSLEKYYWNDV